MANLAKELHGRSWRTQETHNRYNHERQEDLKDDNYCPLCNAPTVKECNYWRIIPNKYPHDAVAEKHEMIVLREHLLKVELSEAAKQESYELKYADLGDNYCFITEALPGSKSIPGHFHLHLIVPKVIGWIFTETRSDGTMRYYA